MLTNEEKKERTRRRIRAATDPDRYYYSPATEDIEHVRNDDYQRVAVYARVSTDDPAQTSSFELQQKYYVDLVAHHPKWVLIEIYSDEGRSGTTTQHREGFLRMMADANAGKIDLIICKNISRLARNVIDFLTTVRELAEKKVGILFESEAIYSLNSESHMTLSTYSMMAENESRIRSRSMETSLRMRLDHGLPLTPELLGFVKDENGKLRINPETYKTPKLMFSMYLYGYSTQQIAFCLNRLSKQSYLGNVKWTANGVGNTLRNERYAGDVRTRKRYKLFAPDAHRQKSFKNTGQRPQSFYMDEHDAIVSRDDYIATQRIMRNAKYGGTSLLPVLRVIPQGLLKGFVIVHPKWGSFTKEDYLNACRSVDSEEEEEVQIQQEAGEFDLRGYEIVNFKLFDEQRIPAINLKKDEIKFNMSCVRGMACDDYIELLVHPIQRKLAIRPTTNENRYALQWSMGPKDRKENRSIACKAFIGTLFDIFDWSQEYKYKLYGSIYRDEKNSACIFTQQDASVYIRKDKLLSGGIDASGKLLNQSGKSVRAHVDDLGNNFGQEYYVEKSMQEMRMQTKEQWQTRIEGQLCSTGDKLNVTPYNELKEFIQQELGDLFEEVHPE